MTNQEVANLLRQIARILEIKGESTFKIRAYDEAATRIENLSDPIEQIWREGKLKDIPGVGESIASKIEEYLKTGKSSYLEEISSDIPESLFALMDVPGIGPKLSWRLYQEAGITSIEELEEALKTHRLQGMRGFGAKMEKKLLDGIQMYRQLSGRIPLYLALPIIHNVISYLKSNASFVDIAPAGSLRRGRADIGDCDVLVATDNPIPVMDAFVKMPGVTQVLAKGDTKTSVFTGGLQVDLRAVPVDSWGAALQYFTGSKAHNIKLRELAIKKGYKLNEYGLFKMDNDEKIAGRTEEEIYNALGLPWIPPTMREDRGEIERAMSGKLPTLVQQKDIKGDTHVHSTFSDGSNSIEEMARKAKELGYEWLVMSDHATGIGVVNGLTPEILPDYINAIREAEKKVGIKIFVGMEGNIKADGTFLFTDERLDVLIAAIHSALNQEKEKILGRYEKAFSDAKPNIVAHPTGRILGRREGMDVTSNEVIQLCHKYGVVPELNCTPMRLDIDDVGVLTAITQYDMPITIGTDSHDTDELDNMALGIIQAQRGWADPDHVINTWPAKKVEEWLKGKNKQ
ncbi:DNA polymerase/3'-5' exonuclease PolX [Coprothermobacter platensis]|uniref:DNA polymerase/3'-5' exonuclease PolX n=1 Tax=Coprothermobacter platensis TaxID=108819 RepID=UPI00036C7A8F|nr:DNA polymerase/3'-5' exonuclease PolX [Coprothermobacter platensis]